MVLLAILGWVLLGLVAVLLVLLVIPIHLAFAVRAGEEAGYRFDVRLVSGRAPPLLRLRSGAESPETEPDRAARSGGRSRKARRRPTGGWSDRPWVRRLIAEAPGAVGRTLGAIRIDRLRARGWFGLEDPADTGMLWGWLAPLRFAAAGPVDLDIRPAFDRAGLGGEAEARLHFTIIRLIAPGLGLILRVAPWRG